MEPDPLGQKMILSDIVIKSRANQHWQYSGMDSQNQCLDKQHFQQYPHTVNYNYNSRGFRDQEWPSDKSELTNAVWCVGDSFTVGLGAPQDHIWPARLSALLNRRVINVSMDGASNQWISRIAQKIINAVNPTHIVIMWSYTHRRELPDSSLSDENRIQHFVKSTVQDDWENFVQCRNTVTQLIAPVEFTVPDFHPIDAERIWHSVRGTNWPQSVPNGVADFDQLPAWIIQELTDIHHCNDELHHAIYCQSQLKNNNVTVVKRQDRSRDGNHFDLITADWVATQAANQINSARN